MKHNLQLTEEEINIVPLGLKKLPWEVSNETIHAIVLQVDAINNTKKEKK